MSDLPSPQLEPSPLFTHAGIDVLGPWSVLNNAQTRQRKPVKVWSLLITCLSSRAVHLEPLVAMDVTALRNALRRFTSRWGTTTSFSSDRGTNFIGFLGEEKTLATLAIEVTNGKSTCCLLYTSDAADE